MNKIKIFIVDDHQMLLDGLKALLEGVGDIELVGTERDPLKAMERIRNLAPQILLTDINMPGMTGVELTAKVKLEFPEVKVIVLSMHSDRQVIADVMKAGADGYILKNTGKADLLNALYKISDGEKYFSSEITSQLLKPTTEETQVLSTREKEIVKLISEENSNAKIAEKLFISERTVETHRKNIFRKTGTKSVLGLIKWATDKGVV